MRLLRELGWTSLCALVAWITYAGLNGWTWDPFAAATWVWVPPLHMHDVYPVRNDLVYLFALVLVAIRHGTRLCATLETRHLGAGLGLASALAALSALAWLHVRAMDPTRLMPRRYVQYVAGEGAWFDSLHFTLPWLLATLAASASCIWLGGRLCRGLSLQVRTGAGFWPVMRSAARELGWTSLCALVAWTTYAGANYWSWDPGSWTSGADLSMCFFALVLVAVRHGVRLCATLGPRHLGAGLGFACALAVMSALIWYSGMPPFQGPPRRYPKYVEEWHGLDITQPCVFATLAATAACIYLAARLSRAQWLQGQTGAKP